MTKDDNHRQQAVVIGSGVAGMTAAVAISPFFDSVKVFDKDELPDGPQLRKGVGQAGHLHSLLLGGLQILEKYLPGISSDLVSAGAVKLRAGLDQQIHEYGQWLPERDLGFVILAQSRLLLEDTIRKRVSKVDNIELIGRQRVLKLLQAETGDVIGVETRTTTEDSLPVLADLVIDASGRGGVFVKQLSSHFPEMAVMDELAANIVYVSAFLQKPPAWRNTKENILIIAQPDQSAGGALIDIEGGRWLVSLHGRNGLVPPGDIDGWKAFAQNLADARIWERIKDAEVDGDVRVFKKPFSTWRRFDKASRFPLGYLPVGDVISSVNPTFGQGMTVAFGHCQALGDALAAGLSGQALSERVRAESAQWSGKAWRVCSAYDSVFAQDGPRREKNFQILQALSKKKQAEAHADPEVHIQLLKQAQMLS